MPSIIEALHGRDASVPPADAVEEVWAAVGRWEELAAEDRHVSFTAGAHGVCIELRALDGELVRPLRPSEALELACGALVA